MIYKHLRKILPQTKEPVIIEVGAHKGTDTIKLLNLCENGRHYAIEPDERNIEDFRQRTQVVPNDNKLYFFNYAISNHNGWQKFYYSQKRGDRILTDCNSLLKPKENHPFTFEEGEVYAIMLDSILGWLPYVTLLWADIQGGELKMIEGGSEVISKTQYLFLECQQGAYYGQPTKQELLDALPDFREVFFDGANIFMERK